MLHGVPVSVDGLPATWRRHQEQDACHHLCAPSIGCTSAFSIHTSLGGRKPPPAHMQTDVDTPLFVEAGMQLEGPEDAEMGDEGEHSCYERGERCRQQVPPRRRRSPPVGAHSQLRRWCWPCSDGGGRRVCGRGGGGGGRGGRRGGGGGGQQQRGGRPARVWHLSVPARGGGGAPLGGGGAADGGGVPEARQVRTPACLRVCRGRGRGVHAVPGAGGARRHPWLPRMDVGACLPGALAPLCLTSCCTHTTIYLAKAPAGTRRDSCQTCPPRRRRRRQQQPTASSTRPTPRTASGRTRSGSGRSGCSAGSTTAAPTWRLTRGWRPATPRSSPAPHGPETSSTSLPSCAAGCRGVWVGVAGGGLCLNSVGKMGV